MHGQRQTTLGLGGDNSLRQKRVLQRYDQARGGSPPPHEPSSRWEMDAQPQQMIAAKAHRMAPQDDTVAAVRQGDGLRTGLLRGGRCGRTLQGRSWGKSGTAARDRCRGDCSMGGQDGLGFGGATGEKQSSEQVLEAMSPLA